MNKYVAQYFIKTKKIIIEHKSNSIVVLQFFQRKDNSILAGMDEVLNLLKTQTNWKKYIIRAAKNGAVINAGDVVLELEGRYQYFGEMEGIIDGVLSRATSLATNARRVVESAGETEVIFMGDRADHFLNQARDGKAIAIGGINMQVTKAHILLHDGIVIGTMPHALIQMFDGDLIQALKAYQKTYPNEKLTALVDFTNDVVSETLRAYKEFGNNLGAIRVDTSPNMSDAMFINNEEYGVTINMIKTLRLKLDSVGGVNVKIIVSSSFSAKKIKEFKLNNAPVDYFGIGASLLQINNTFTADAVKINNKYIAKAGRKYRKHLLKKIS